MKLMRNVALVLLAVIICASSVSAACLRCCTTKIDEHGCCPRSSEPKPEPDHKCGLSAGDLAAVKAESKSDVAAALAVAEVVVLAEQFVSFAAPARVASHSPPARLAAVLRI